MYFFFLTFRLLAAICYFQPPESWECAIPEKLSESVQIGFLGKGKRELPPSINLATEKTDCSLKEYVKIVKELHEKEMHISWRDLGDFTFRAGKGRLGEITASSPFGEIKMLQGILVKDGWAYVLTGSALREEFPEFRGAILAALRSLSLSADLFSAISNPASQEMLKQLFEQFNSLESPSLQKQEWESLQKILSKEFAQMGQYWHYLVLKEAHKLIFAGQKPSLQ